MNLSHTLELRQPATGLLNKFKSNGIKMTEEAVEIVPLPEVPEDLNKHIDVACGRIAPLWPLKHFVAVNPFFGLRDMHIQHASDTLARISGSKLYMDWAYYRELIDEGQISLDDLKLSISRVGSSLDVDTLQWTLNAKPPRPNLGMASVSEVLDRLDDGIWMSFVTERISLHCAAYFDMGQATHKMPWRDLSLYKSWRKAAQIDFSPAMMGLKNFRHKVRELPQEPRNVIAWAVTELGIPTAATERYLHASLLDVGGWAAWTRYQRWQAELKGQEDDSIVDLLAIKLAYDVLIYKDQYSEKLAAHWHEMLQESMREPSVRRRTAAQIDRILLNAAEIAFQRNVIGRLADKAQNPSDRSDAQRPAVQAAFCIDVRSEVYRRALETVTNEAQTIGFAGFFGVPIEYVQLGSSSARSHVPVIFNPKYRIAEQLNDVDTSTQQQQQLLRRERIGLMKMWKGFKYSASSCFSFVEATGLVYLFKLLSDSFGWTRPVPDPVTQGLSKGQISRIGLPLQAEENSLCCAALGPIGIPEAERVDLAERILRGMSLTQNFARLVVLAGHGSTSVNNPHATSLDCGACAGQTGEASARVVANLLNLPEVRLQLRERGIDIPADTWFLAAMHDTTTDDLRYLDAELVPHQHQHDLQQLDHWFEQASEISRMQRATMLGLEGKSSEEVEAEVRRRSNDWSQVRPEWALANNAAFIAAPRNRTRCVKLEGRAFLHDYEWQKDSEFSILELIMTAPMIVANWINMQYYGSVVDNRHFGSGNKVLHNIVGGAIGVLEGNGGDLRVGLPLQSLHDGDKWVHEPLRLSVFIEAPQAAIEDIIGKHEIVRQLIENHWLHLFRIDTDGVVQRRVSSNYWERSALN